MKPRKIVWTYSATVGIYWIDCVVEKELGAYKLTISIDCDEVRYLTSNSLEILQQFAYGYIEGMEMLAGFIKANL